jgi:hypothetical protein
MLKELKLCVTLFMEDSVIKANTSISIKVLKSKKTYCCICIQRICKTFVTTVVSYHSNFCCRSGDVRDPHSDIVLKQNNLKMN